MLVCSGRPTQSMRGAGYPRGVGGRGIGTVSAITPNSEPLRRIEHAARVELDDHAEHVVVLQQIGKLLELADVPGEIERVGTQPGEHPDIALGCRRPLLVVHRERQLATVRQCADAALDHLPRSIALQDIEPEA